ncbi:precorrin-4 C(11)-methyltransferase [Carboxylicivirga linearis]|uniref:Precorrin-4 C(11)-methyltransferase n=1 Tax=Carboxylicivirga linearis TaxID=1628157 RepID=A0ABS5JXQ3_9BACT|nr:precorrin-4 C(11)-methyltransferase [Carboxylicivirga linearis]MBS2099575.1 precorrin-4 C(11)-methyltransferase [Carboxylicivirga linearis]
MKHENIHIITHSNEGEKLAQRLVKEGIHANIHRNSSNIDELWKTADALIYIGALGICVRTIAPLLVDKHTDPAVINMDANGSFVQSVVSGHVGGANQLCSQISNILGAQPVITTVSDTSGLWALDMLPSQYNWQMETTQPLTQIISLFVNRKPTALLLQSRDRGTLVLETEIPDFVTVFTEEKDINEDQFDLIIAVTPFVHQFTKPTIFYRPQMINLGVGCQRDIDSELFSKELDRLLEKNKISKLSIANIGTIELKADEKALNDYANSLNQSLKVFSDQQLDAVTIPNPSEKVESVTGSSSVAEASAMLLSENNLWLEKVKAKAGDKYFTCAVAINAVNQRKGMVEIVGAGPGDPELVSVRGKRLLQSADLILYAGSLVPKELTYYAKPGCVVKSSAGMDLQTQIDTMKPFYDRGLLVVRLHTGDPCIYGAIQEQMAKMDELKMDYRITPGISSFQAAAAALKSQFTIPEEIQSIILTRGEGRTPMPEKEQLHKLAQSQSTMCIYLSASIAEKVQSELMVHYPAETPVAICYKLTWKDEKIWRTTLENLAQTVNENNLSMTTMIVVGKSIGNRSGESKLYHKQFTHAFRKGEE